MLNLIKEYVLDFSRTTPLFYALVALIVCDVLSGIAVACVRGTLNSSINMIGATRKSFMVMLVVIGKILEPYAQGVPVAQLVAGFYCATELISIFENAGALGLPLPKALREMMSKLKSDGEMEVQIPRQKIRIKKPPSEVFDVSKKDPADSDNSSHSEPA